jgi:hypothetical protein
MAARLFRDETNATPGRNEHRSIARGNIHTGAEFPRDDKYLVRILTVYYILLKSYDLTHVRSIPEGKFLFFIDLMHVFYCSQVHDYVKTYVGEGKPQKKFAMEYLERRSRWKNALKSGGKYADDHTTPALALSPGDGDFQVRPSPPPPPRKKRLVQGVSFCGLLLIKYSRF